MTKQPSSVIAVIPARGGSKGVPRKNLREVAGTPLLVHSIGHALAAPGIERVIVSTEDDEIGRVARGARAEVVWRPAELAGDHASSESALEHVLDALTEAGESEPEAIVFLQATSPIRPAGAVQAALDVFAESQADSLFSTSPLHGFVWQLTATGPQPIDYDPRRRPRRQDIPEQVVENGSIYIFRPWVLRRLGCRLGGTIVTYPMDFLAALQVDTPADLELADQLLAERSW